MADDEDEKNENDVPASGKLRLSKRRINIRNYDLFV